VRTTLAACSAPDSKNALTRNVVPACKVASTTAMKIGKTNANSTAGDPVSSPASFRPSRLILANNFPMDRILVRPRIDSESCARSHYFGLIPNV
jgi:hypothetical protein